MDPETAARIDGFLTALAKETDERCALLREHLDAAKYYALGAMPDEYRLNLRLVNDTLNCVAEDSLRRELSDFVDNELAIGRVK